MNSLNLIYPEQSSIQFKTMVFPDGQPHIKLDVDSTTALSRQAPLKIVTRITNASELLMVLLVKNTLDYMLFEHIELHISYLLAARMDRVMLDGEPFSLKVIANMLNHGNFKRVYIFDPHSEVSTALIDRSYAINNHSFVKDVLAHYFDRHDPSSFCIVSPDAGALKKIHKLAQYLDVDDVVECMKERNLKTGALTNFKTTTDHLEGQICFIIDDICDGGGTFAGTGALLKERGAKKVILIVSHGIFSKGVEIPGIDVIYATDSYRVVEGINCFAVGHYLL